MTDKTDALEARLRMHARDCVSAADMDTDTVLSAAQIDDMADALNEAAETLAAPAEGGQPAGAVVPEGWKLVPIVATPSMDAAGKEALSDNGVADVHDADALVCFAAMLAAAPAAPKGGVVDEAMVERALDSWFGIRDIWAGGERAAGNRADMRAALTAALATPRAEQGHEARSAPMSC